MGGAGAAIALTQNKAKIFAAGMEAYLQYKPSNDKGFWLIPGNYNF
jgi:hypothetical protein